MLSIVYSLSRVGILWFLAHHAARVVILYCWITGISGCSFNLATCPEPAEGLNYLCVLRPLICPFSFGVAGIEAGMPHELHAFGRDVLHDEGDEIERRESDSVP
jgi:hypothetical protein